MSSYRFSSLRRPIQWSFALFSLALGSAPAATLTTSFGATLSNSVSCPGYGANQSSSTSVSVTSNGPCVGGNGSIDGAADAFPGHLGAFAGSTGVGSTGSSAIFDGFVTFDATGISNATSVFASLNLDIDGFMLSTGDMAQGQFSDAQLGIQITFNGNFFLYREQIFNQRASLLDPRNSLTLSPGGRVSAPGSAVYNGFLSTPFVQVPLGLSVPLLIRLDVLAEGYSGTSDFFSSLDVPVGSDVFTLPPAFTANSTDLNVTDNRFGASASAVPEPATLALFPLGLAALFILRRRSSQPSRRQSGADSQVCAGRPRPALK